MTREMALEHARHLAGELRETLGERLVMMAAYGSVVRGDYDSVRSNANMFFCVQSSDLETLAEIALPIQRARVLFRCAPFVLSRDEIARSGDVFAVKFAVIRRNYLVLEGEDVLASLAIEPRDLRFVCEYELRNVSIRLRRAFLLEAPHVGPVVGSLRIFLPQVLGVLRLLTNDEVTDGGDQRCVIDAASKIGFEPQAILEMLLLRDEARTPWPEIKRRLRAFFVALNRISEYVDRLSQI